VWCWGCGNFGVLGALGAGNHVAPVRVPGVSAVRIAAETEATCAIAASGHATCWGEGSQFGTSLTNAPTAPREAPFAEGAIDVDVGVVFACAAREGAVTCDGALYDFATCQDHRVDTRAFRVPGVREVSVGYEDACARDAEGAVWCWGCNLSGLAGAGANGGKPSPTRVTLGR
jgi:alpha-tubulin suppressor-like RCC1 family protein